MCITEGALLDIRAETSDVTSRHGTFNVVKLLDKYTIPQYTIPQYTTKGILYRIVTGLYLPAVVDHRLPSLPGLAQRHAVVAPSFRRPVVVLPPRRRPAALPSPPPTMPIRSPHLLARTLSSLRRTQKHTTPSRLLSTTPGRLTDSSGLGPKRFYDHVLVKPASDWGHTVLLDGKPVLTPRRIALRAPSHALALAVAAEWDAVTGRVRPSAMPLTALAGAALDVVPPFRPRSLASLLRFAHTDSACIRPDAPHELVDQQDQAYGPIVQHVEQAARAPLRVVRGALHADQSDDIERWVHSAAAALDCWSLAALESAASTAKSVFVALALQASAVDAAQAVAAARSEERWQADVWGSVEGGHDMDEADAMVRMTAAEVLFRLIDAERDVFDKISHRLLADAAASADGGGSGGGGDGSGVEKRQ